MSFIVGLARNPHDNSAVQRIGFHLRTCTAAGIRGRERASAASVCHNGQRCYARPPIVMEQQPQFEIRFIRLDDDVCEALNRISKDTNRRVSDIANEALREWLGESFKSVESRV